MNCPLFIILNSIGLLDCPNEVIVTILQKLTLRSVIQTMSFTCKCIYWLCHTAVLWKYFTLEETGHVHYTMYSFQRIFERHARHFKHLHFYGEFHRDLLYFPRLNFDTNLINCFNLVVLNLTSNVHIVDISFIKKFQI